LAGDPAGAEAVLQKALLLSPQDWLAQWMVVANLIASNQLSKAKEALDRALVAHPTERVFHDYLGTWYVRQSKYREAEAAFRRSIALKPSGSVGYLSLNMVLMREERLDEALTALQQGLQVRPNHRLYSNLGVALFLKGRYQEAAEADQRALDTVPPGLADDAYWFNLAEAVEHLPDQRERALDIWRKALTSVEQLARRFPANARYASYAGLTAAKLGEREPAQRWTASALSLSGQNADVWFNAALAAALGGETELARDRAAQAQHWGYPASWIAREPLLAQFVQSPALAKPLAAGPRPAASSAPR
jgi:serine/threonine-protein kinase